MEEVTGTVIIPGDDTDVSGLLRFDAIDANVLLNGMFAIVMMAMGGLVAVVFAVLFKTHNLMAPEGVRQVQETTFQGAYQLWQRVGDRVEASPGVEDDLLYNLANIPVETMKKHFEGLGFKVAIDEAMDTTGTGAGDKGIDPLA
jgi:hypothetical protein